MLSAAHFAPRVALSWQGSGWRPDVSAAPVRRDELTVLTWNVLFDRYDSGELHSPTRRGLLLDALQDLDDVDVIAMQEVQSTVLRPLMATAWMRAGWRVVLPGTPKDVDQFGLVLLARVPVRETGFLQYSGRKGALAMVVDGVSGPRVLVTTHLTSDHTEGAGARRDQQLLQLRAALDASGGESVVLGDLNVAGPVPNLALGLRDVGVSAPTFDPACNPLASICSQTGEALCIDRVLVSPHLRGTGAVRVGMDAQKVDVEGVNALHISDHFGVRVTVGPRAGVVGAVQ